MNEKLVAKSKLFSQMILYGFRSPDMTVTEFVDIFPVADVREVRHGRWLLEREPDGTPYCFHCSVCDEDFVRTSVKSAYPICPWCGAEMDLKEEADADKL